MPNGDFGFPGFVPTVHGSTDMQKISNILLGKIPIFSQIS